MKKKGVIAGFPKQQICGNMEMIFLVEETWK